MKSSETNNLVIFCDTNKQKKITKQKKANPIYKKIAIGIIVITCSIGVGAEYYIQYNSPKGVEERQIIDLTEELNEKVTADYGSAFDYKVAMAGRAISDYVFVLMDQYNVSYEIALEYVWDYGILDGNIDPLRDESPKGVENARKRIFEEKDYPKN